MNGVEIGEHAGLMYYTIGQRSGLHIGGVGGPWFVYGKDIVNNRLLVTNEEHIDLLYSDELQADDLVWINPDLIPSQKSFDCTAKFRYRQPDQKVTVTQLDDTHIQVSFHDKVRAVTPGQAVVLYLDDVCLGGATIHSVYLNNTKLDYL